MTNEQIVFNVRIQLQKENLIGSTGRKIVLENDNGEKEEIMEPEEIHTYQAWKKKGYQVQKGQKAIAKFKIWKHVTKKAESENEPDDEKMFMVNSAFFSSAQVAAI